MIRGESCQHWLKSSRTIRDANAIPIRWERYCQTCTEVFDTRGYERLPDGGYRIEYRPKAEA